MITLPKILQKTDNTSVAIEAAYYVIRLIWHRALLDDVKKDHLVKDLESEPSLKAQKIARGVITKIESSENCKIQKLSTEKATEYIKELEQFITQRLSKELGVKKGAGLELLKQLRQSSMYKRNVEDVPYLQLDDKVMTAGVISAVRESAKTLLDLMGEAERSLRTFNIECALSRKGIQVNESKTKRGAFKKAFREIENRAVR